jgi:hypothetical protein
MQNATVVNALRLSMTDRIVHSWYQGPVVSRNEIKEPQLMRQGDRDFQSMLEVEWSLH